MSTNVMRNSLVVAILGLLVGCKTIIIPEYQPIDPPLNLMEPAEKLQEIPVEPDGTVKANNVLVTDIINLTKSKKTENKLTSLQQFIIEYNKKVEELNKEAKKNK